MSPQRQLYVYLRLFESGVVKAFKRRINPVLSYLI